MQAPGKLHLFFPYQGAGKKQEVGRAARESPALPHWRLYLERTPEAAAPAGMGGKSTCTMLTSSQTFAVW